MQLKIKCYSIFQLHYNIYYLIVVIKIFCHCDNISRPKSCDMIIAMYVIYIETRAGNRLRFLKSIITNFKLINNSVEVIWPIKSINTGNSSHLMIKKASCLFHIVHYLPLHAGKVCLEIITIINITDSQLIIRRILNID